MVPEAHPSALADALANSAAPPFDIVRAARVELVVRDLEASERFYADALGLIVSERSEDALYLRGWEERVHHSIVLRRGAEPALSAVGFLVGGAGDLGKLSRFFTDVGADVRPGVDERTGAELLRVQDAQGFPLEFFHRSERVPSRLQHFHEHRGAPILRLDHFNLHSPDPLEAARAWLALGFRCTEYISTDGEPEELTGCWMRRAPSVHDVALTVGSGPRLHHFGVWVGDAAGVLRCCDQLAASGYASAIERGPGRHGVSNAFFVYLRDPDGHRIELYACDYWTGDPQHEPLRWSVTDPSCRSFWGTRAPASWYDESTVVLDLDGREVALSHTKVDERSELMA
jgi:3,4-dihydroxyphenylacetate 2,3-dioxygenase